MHRYAEEERLSLQTLCTILESRIKNGILLAIADVFTLFVSRGQVIYGALMSFPYADTPPGIN
jgi:hypothetical protein